MWNRDKGGLWQPRESHPCPGQPLGNALCGLAPGAGRSGPQWRQAREVMLPPHPRHPLPQPPQDGRALQEPALASPVPTGTHTRATATGRVMRGNVTRMRESPLLPGLQAGSQSQTQDQKSSSLISSSGPGLTEGERPLQILSAFKLIGRPIGCGA